MEVTIVPFLYKLNRLIINPLILLAFALAFLYFTYSVFNFLRKDAADKSRTEARNAILWSIVGMVIMFSVYGIIQFILKSFGITPGDIGPDGGQFIHFP